MVSVCSFVVRDICASLSHVLLVLFNALSVPAQSKLRSIRHHEECFTVCSHLLLGSFAFNESKLRECLLSQSPTSG